MLYFWDMENKRLHDNTKFELALVALKKVLSNIQFNMASIYVDVNKVDTSELDGILNTNNISRDEQ